MIRPPSNQRHYDEFYSGDPAFIPPPVLPVDPSQDQIRDHAELLAAHEHKFSVARDTGNWAGLVVDGQQPTKFVMRVIPGTVASALADLAGDKIKHHMFILLAFRAGITNIVNGGDVRVTLSVDRDFPLLGKIADASVTDYLWSIEDADGNQIGPNIIGEIALRAWQRSQGISPK